MPSLVSLWSVAAAMKAAFVRQVGAPLAACRVSRSGSLIEWDFFAF